MNKQTLHEISILLTNPLYFVSGIRKGGSSLIEKSRAPLL